MPSAASLIATPVCPVDVVLVNWNRPFWLLVLPGIGCTLIWSKSSSPEYSKTTPPLNVCRFLTHGIASEKVWIGPCDDEGYGPPSISVKFAMVMVGILSGISLKSGKMYG